MNSHSNTTNAIGDKERKDVYEVGDLVTTYLSESRKYEHGIIVEVINRQWVKDNNFKNIYKIYIQDGPSYGRTIVERYRPDTYLSHMKQKLNTELPGIRTNRQPYNIKFE